MASKRVSLMVRSISSVSWLSTIRGEYKENDLVLKLKVINQISRFW